MGDALCQVLMMSRKKMDVTKWLLTLIYPLHEKADGAGAGAPRQKPLSLTHSPLLLFYRQGERWDGRCLLFGNTLSLPLPLLISA